MFNTIIKTRDSIRSNFQNISFHRYINLVLIMVSCAFDLINVTAVLSATRDIENTYQIEFTTASWALTAYAITFAGFIAFLGRVGDIIGNSVLFVSSCFLFSILSLICAVVNNFGTFAVFRALQGIAAAGVVPSGYALIPTLSDEHEVQSFFAIVSCGFSTSFGIGFIIGGAFTLTRIGYKGIFYLTFAVMLVISIISYFSIGTSANQEPCTKDSPKTTKWSDALSLDFIGSFMFISSTILIVVGLTEGGESWKKPSAYVTLIVGIALFVLFFVWNICYGVLVKNLKSVSNPKVYNYFRTIQVLIPKDVLMMKNFIPITMAVFANYGCLFSNLYIVNQYCQYVSKNSPLLAAVKLLPLVVSMLIPNVVIAIKSDLISPRKAVVLGFFIMFIGSLISIQLHLITDNLYWKIFFCSQSLIAFGAAIFFPYSLNILIGFAPDEYKGIASGVMQTFGQFGVEVTFSVMTSILGNINELSGKSGSAEIYKTRFQNCTYFTLASSVVGLISTAFFVKENKPTDDTGSLSTICEEVAREETKDELNLY